MDSDTICSLVYAVDTYFGLTFIINEQIRHKFASLLLIENAANYYDKRNKTSNATWGTLKSDLLSRFKLVNYNRLNHEAFNQCRQKSPDVLEYLKAFKLALLRCNTHFSEEESLHRFQQGLWDEVKVQVLVQHLAILKATAEIADRVGYNPYLYPVWERIEET